MSSKVVGWLVFALALGTPGFAAAQSMNAPPSTGRLGMAGEWHSADGTIYLRNRVYHPRMRRFLQRDAVLGSSSVPMSLNRYTYVEGNPATWTDPTGRQAQKTQCPPGDVMVGSLLTVCVRDVLYNPHAGNTQCPPGQMLLPGGGCAHENFWEHLANFTAGMGDSITGMFGQPFGFTSPTESLRNALGGGDVIDKSSFGYTAGGGTGTALVTVAGLQGGRSGGGTRGGSAHARSGGSVAPKGTYQHRRFPDSTFDRGVGLAKVPPPRMTAAERAAARAAGPNSIVPTGKRPNVTDIRWAADNLPYEAAPFYGDGKGLIIGDSASISSDAFKKLRITNPGARLSPLHSHPGEAMPVPSVTDAARRTNPVGTEAITIFIY
jgi:RHS repeat-associated protein